VTGLHPIDLQLLRFVAISFYNSLQQMVLIAHSLGGTAHLSPLLRKVRKLGLRTPDALLRLAVVRGCHHYAPADFDHIAEAATAPSHDLLGHEELAVAMISAAQEQDPRLIRCAAQLLGAPETSVETLARLACMERCSPLLAYIARHAIKWDASRSDFWRELLLRIPAGGPQDSEFWPHPSRFVVQSGYQRGGGTPAPLWLRPSPGGGYR